METNKFSVNGGTQSLCAFAKLPNATISFVTSICTSLRLSALTTRLPQDGIYEILYSSVLFSKICV